MSSKLASNINAADIFFSIFTIIYFLSCSKPRQGKSAILGWGVKIVYKKPSPKYIQAIWILTIKHLLISSLTISANLIIKFKTAHNEYGF